MMNITIYKLQPVNHNVLSNFDSGVIFSIC